MEQQKPGSQVLPDLHFLKAERKSTILTGLHISLPGKG